MEDHFKKLGIIFAYAFRHIGAFMSMAALAYFIIPNELGSFTFGILVNLIVFCYDYYKKDIKNFTIGKFLLSFFIFLLALIPVTFFLKYLIFYYFKDLTYSPIYWITIIAFFIATLGTLLSLVTSSSEKEKKFVALIVAIIIISLISITVTQAYNVNPQMDASLTENEVNIVKKHLNTSVENTAISPIDTELTVKQRDIILEKLNQNVEQNELASFILYISIIMGGLQLYIWSNSIKKKVS